MQYLITTLKLSKILNLRINLKIIDYLFMKIL